ncbi:MAG: type IV pilus modification protein PilV [Proteobacteria bacterium]|nr:type IV pilus modification protein PilV [Pseudomonadota bacterium]
MRKMQTGFTLLEVLIAVLIVSLCMMSIAAVLVTVHRSTNSGYLAQQSSQLASDIIARMRQNSAAAQSGSYNVSYTGGSITAPGMMCDPSGSGPCSGAQLAAYDVWQWLNVVNTTLPGANATVTVTLTANNNYDVVTTVSFDDTPAGTTLHSSSNRRTFQLETLL